MADINHTISLGIGSPAGVPEFLTFGLQIGAAITINTPLCRTYAVASDSRTMPIDADARVMAIASDSRIFPVEDCE